MTSRHLFLLILLIYLALATGYSVAQPLGEAPDEADHYAYIRYLGLNHSLPQGPDVTQSKHPPFYHALVASLTAWTGLDFDFLRSNPDGLPLGPDKPPNFFVHTRLEAFPWTGGALAMHLARFLSVLLGGITLWATWLLGEEIFPDRPAVGLLAAAFLAGLPGYLFISGAINNDNAAGLFGALILLLSTRTLRRGLSWRRSLLLGLGLGLGLLSKVGVLAVWPLAGLAIAGVWWLNGPSRRSLTKPAGHLLLSYGLGLLIAAPWLLRNWRLYNSPLAWELVRLTVDERLEPLRLADLGWLAWGLHRTFWGRFGPAGQVQLPLLTYTAAALATVILVVGAIRFLVTRPPLLASGRLLIALLALAPLAVLASIVQYSTVALGTDQARLMWPAIAAIAVWAGAGLTGLADWLGKGRKQPVLAAFAILPALFGLAVLFDVLRPAFAPPPPVTTPAAAPLATFDRGLELLAAELPASPIPAGQSASIRLIWRAATPLNDDLRPALRLVHSDGWLAAEWSHAPAGGRFAADRWPAGPAYADDYLLAPQPPTPGLYHVQVGVRPFGGDWLNAQPSGPAAPFVTLGEVRFD